MAEVTRYVNQAADAGGDGTTNNTSSGDGSHAYNTLAVWEAAEQTDLVSDGDTHVVICSNGGASSSGAFVNVTGWTTGASNYITIKPAEGEEADTQFDTSNFYSGMLSLYEAYTVVEDLQVGPENSGGGIRLFGTNSRAERCHVRLLITTTSTSFDSTGIYLWPNSGANSGHIVVNNIIHLTTQSPATRVDDVRGIWLSSGITDCLIFNNTVVNDAYSTSTSANAAIEVGATGSDTHRIENNIVIGQDARTRGIIQNSSTPNYTASWDDEPTGGTGNRLEQTFTFTSFSSGDLNPDFDLDAADTAAKGYGTDLSSDADYPVVGAIGGATRSGSWDIGAAAFIEPPSADMTFPAMTSSGAGIVGVIDGEGTPALGGWTSSGVGIVGVINGEGTPTLGGWTSSGVGIVGVIDVEGTPALGAITASSVGIVGDTIYEDLPALHSTTYTGYGIHSLAIYNGVVYTADDTSTAVAVYKHTIVDGEACVSTSLGDNFPTPSVDGGTFRYISGLITSNSKIYGVANSTVGSALYLLEIDPADDSVTEVVRWTNSGGTYADTAQGMKILPHPSDTAIFFVAGFNVHRVSTSTGADTHILYATGTPEADNLPFLNAAETELWVATRGNEIRRLSLTDLSEIGTIAYTGGEAPASTARNNAMVYPCQDASYFYYPSDSSPDPSNAYLVAWDRTTGAATALRRPDDLDEFTPQSGGTVRLASIFRQDDWLVWVSKKSIAMIDVSANSPSGWDPADASTLWCAAIGALRNTSDTAPVSANMNAAFPLNGQIATLDGATSFAEFRFADSSLQFSAPTVDSSLSEASVGNLTIGGTGYGTGITDRGYYIGLTSNPSTKVSEGGSGSGAFSDGRAIAPGETYYTRSYATNASGESRGLILSIVSTDDTPPAVTSPSVGAVNATEVSVSWNPAALGASRWGLIFGESSNSSPEISDYTVLDWIDADTLTLQGSESWTNATIQDPQTIRFGPGGGSLTKFALTPGKTYRVWIVGESAQGTQTSAQDLGTVAMPVTYSHDSLTISPDETKTLTEMNLVHAFEFDPGRDEIIVGTRAKPAASSTQHGLGRVSVDGGYGTLERFVRLATEDTWGFTPTGQYYGQVEACVRIGRTLYAPFVFTYNTQTHWILYAIDLDTWIGTATSLQVENDTYVETCVTDGTDVFLSAGSTVYKYDVSADTYASVDCWSGGGLLISPATIHTMNVDGTHVYPTFVSSATTWTRVTAKLNKSDLSDTTLRAYHPVTTDDSDQDDSYIYLGGEDVQAGVYNDSEEEEGPFGKTRFRCSTIAIRKSDMEVFTLPPLGTLWTHDVDDKTTSTWCYAVRVFGDYILWLGTTGAFFILDRTKDPATYWGQDIDIFENVVLAEANFTDPPTGTQNEMLVDVEGSVHVSFWDSTPGPSSLAKFTIDGYNLASTPTLTTDSATVATNGDVTFDGTMTVEGQDSVTEWGYQYGDASPPTTKQTVAGPYAVGDMPDYVWEDAVPGTTYYVRSYATNSYGDGYGNILSFVTTATKSLFYYVNYLASRGR